MSVRSLFDLLPERPMTLCEDITVFDADAAALATDLLADPARWLDLEVDRRWAAIGENAHGDTWLAGPDGGVWLFDHNHGELAAEVFEPLRIDVTEWLILGHALGRFEKLADPSDDDIARLDALLESISPGLSDRYPYPLPFS